MTRSLLLTITAVGLALVMGWWGRGFVEDRNGGAPASMESGPCGNAAPLYWKAPMDPSYVRDEPGKSPMGMDLVPVCPGESDAPAGGTIGIDPQTIQNIGVRTEPVQRRDLTRAIRALGRVAADERRVEHVHTKVQGWVESLYVDFVGQEVQRGQPLLEVYSPELVATQEELLVAAGYRNATSASPVADVRASGASLYEATRRRLELWDISQREIEKLLATGEVQKTLTLYAPTSGFVTSLGVRVGMEVGPNNNLYTITDLSKVWVLADVYENELPWVELGRPGAVELSSLPGRHFGGPVTYIAPFLDPKTRTAELRLELSNDSGDLRPEMFGNVLIEGTRRRDVIAVPSEAVIRSGRRDLVVVALGAGRFSPRQVTLGMDSGDGWVEVVDGIETGEEIVVSSQFLIDSESNLQEAVKKLLANEANAPSTDSHETMDHSMHEMDHSGHDMSHEGAPDTEASGGAAERSEHGDGSLGHAGH